MRFMDRVTDREYMVYHRSLTFLVVILFACTGYAFDHEYGNYGSVLGKHIREDRVDYSALQKDRTGIDQFVKEIGEVSGEEYQTWSRDQQLAFWINAYNGWFLQIVINHYPIQGGRLIGVLYPKNSVQRIPGIWENIKTKAAGRTVSLNDIEHKILRTIFREPRIHFAIVCASVGCPSIRPEPFLPARLESQLEDAARIFVNDPRKVKWDADRKKLEVSSIFDWFSDDFNSFANDDWRKLYSKKHAGIVAFLSKYLPQPASESLRTTGVKVEFLDYDWTLNDLKKK